MREKGGKGENVRCPICELFSLFGVEAQEVHMPDSKEPVMVVELELVEHDPGVKNCKHDE